MNSRGSPVGYLFSDIEESTERWEKYPAQMQLAVARHDALIDEIVARHGGVIQDRAGDGVFATFRSGNPLQCALDIQLEMQRSDWSAVGGLLVRVGVHTGAAIDQGKVDRPAINRASRIMSSAWGGQIVVSAEAKAAYAAPADSNLMDLGVCRFKGIEEPIRLCSLVHPVLQRTEFPPPRSQLLHGLTGPDVSEPMFGRQRELEEVLARLATCRLVTIIGHGGNGKTRLAAQVAADDAERRPICFASLESVTGGERLAPAIAEALRFSFHGVARPEDQLIGYMRQRQMLLVLDNAETIAGEASFVSKLIAACPQLTVLVTSREPLGLAGESLFRLSGLALPSRDPSEALNSPVLRFFLREAQIRDEEFQLSGAQANAFYEICELVDGSPLALRLIAQWMQVLSLEEILERLRDGPDLLSASNPHQRQTIRGVFEASWSLLDAKQREALARLSVFVKAFDWIAASHVAELSLETFAALERKGLLEQMADRRFALHPLVRRYAREKLAQSGADDPTARRRHSTYYLDAVCSGSESSPERSQGATLELLRRDFSEIRAAWFYAIKIDAKPLILRAIEPLCYFLYTRSMFRDALEVFAAPTLDDSLKRYLASIQGSFLVHQGDTKRAAAIASGVLAVPGGPRRARAHAHHTLGNLAHIRGDFAQAQLHYDRALAIRAKAGDLAGCCYSAISLSALHLMFGRVKEARERVKHGFRLARQIGDVFGTLASHVYAGDIAVLERRFEAAQENFERALRLEESIQNPQFRSMLFRRLGSLFLLRGNHEQALDHHRQAYGLAAELGDQRTCAHALIELGNVHRVMNQLEAAKINLLRGVRLSMVLGMQPSLTRGLLELAHVELRAGNTKTAQRLAGVLHDGDLGSLRSSYDALVVELDGGVQAVAEVVTVQDLLNEIIADADVDSLRL